MAVSSIELEADSNRNARMKAAPLNFVHSFGFRGAGTMPKKANRFVPGERRRERRPRRTSGKIYATGNRLSKPGRR